MRQMTCVNGGRYRSESFNGPEQKNKIKILFSLSLSSCSGMFSSVSPDPPFSSSNQKVIFFKQISQGHLNTAPESYTHSVEEKNKRIGNIFWFLSETHPRAQRLETVENVKQKSRLL
jgi:hypothetical protein